MYGVPIDKVKIKFDGDALKDTDSPSKLDMEDGDLIDISVRCVIFDARAFMRCKIVVSIDGQNAGGSSAGKGQEMISSFDPFPLVHIAFLFCSFLHLCIFLSHLFMIFNLYVLVTCNPCSPLRQHFFAFENIKFVSNLIFNCG